MTDERVSDLLDSSESLVAIEAPAGCGKTFQGAGYAVRAAKKMQRGRVLVLSHTNAACSVFRAKAREGGADIEVRTMDSLMISIAAAYHKVIDLPPDPAKWARSQPDGFDEIQRRVQQITQSNPMILSALSARYPIVVGDEYQDSSEAQHDVLQGLHAAGSSVRIFSDPSQDIYNKKKTLRAKAKARWESLKEKGVSDRLRTPHRWADGSSDLGEWILDAREALSSGNAIDLRAKLPAGLSVLQVANTSRRKAGFATSSRQEIDDFADRATNLLVLSAQNETVRSLRSFWHRKIPIWEGHTRDELNQYILALQSSEGDTSKIAKAVAAFLSKTAVGFSASSWGGVLLEEASTGASAARNGRPAAIQVAVKFILAEPSHIGAANALRHLGNLVKSGDLGADCKIDHAAELRDAIGLGQFSDIDAGLSEQHRRRSFSQYGPPRKSISTVHKAKGLECASSMLIPCDRANYPSNDYGRCKLYVALSRGKEAVQIVLDSTDPSPLFRI